MPDLQWSSSAASPGALSRLDTLDLLLRYYGVSLAELGHLLSQVDGRSKEDSGLSRTPFAKPLIPLLVPRPTGCLSCYLPVAYFLLYGPK